MRIRVGAALALAVMAAATGCSSSDAAKEQIVPSPASCTADDVKVTGAAGSKPSIAIPDTCVPTKALVTKDLTVGTGPDVKAGVTMDTHYLLVTWSDKKELDSSWKRGEPFPLKNVGKADVIDGWNEGLIGMKEGGRRLLIIPPEKGYGQGGQGIKPNETLVFVVDAVKVTPGS